MSTEIDRLKERVCYCMSQECEEAIDFTGVGYQGEQKLVVFVSALTPAVETWRQRLGSHLSSRVTTRKGNFILNDLWESAALSSSVDSREAAVVVGLNRGSRVGRGSVGCFLLDDANKRYLVSTQHSNPGVGGDARSGSDVIGTVREVGDLADPMIATKVVDAALIDLLDTTNDLEGAFCDQTDRLTGRTVGVRSSDVVEKCGVTSANTRGEVLVTDACVLIDSRDRHGIKLEHQIIVTNRDDRLFAEPGDSGSLVVKDGDAVGIWMGFDEDQEYFAVNPMDWVLCRLSEKTSLNLRIKPI